MKLWPGCSFLFARSWIKEDASVFCICLDHDNSWPHSSAVIHQRFSQFRWEVLDYPAYTPDLAPSDFHLFFEIWTLVWEYSIFIATNIFKRAWSHHTGCNLLWRKFWKTSHQFDICLLWKSNFHCTIIAHLIKGRKKYPSNSFFTQNFYFYLFYFIICMNFKFCIIIIQK